MANIPFFDMFAELQSLPELRLKLAGAELFVQVSDDMSVGVACVAAAIANDRIFFLVFKGIPP